MKIGIVTTKKDWDLAKDMNRLLVGEINKKPIFSYKFCTRCGGTGAVDVQSEQDDYVKEWCQCIYG